MFKSALLTTVLLVAPATLNGLTQSAHAQTPSGGTAGVTSGAPAANNNTTYSVPSGGTVTGSSNVTVTTGADGQPTINVPPAVLTEAGNQVSFTLSTQGAGGETIGTVITIAATVTSLNDIETPGILVIIDGERQTIPLSAFEVGEGGFGSSFQQVEIAINDEKTVILQVRGLIATLETVE